MFLFDMTYLCQYYGVSVGGTIKKLAENIVPYRTTLVYHTNVNITMSISSHITKTTYCMTHVQVYIIVIMR